MDKHRFTQYFFITIHWIILICLLIGVGMFVKDVWKEFYLSTTSLKVYSINSTNITPPTLTICFNPGAKESTLKEFNITMKQFAGFQDFDKKLNYPDLYEKGIYKLCTDFSIFLWYDRKNYIDGCKNPAYKNYIEEIYTYFGLCFKLSMDFTVRPFRYITVGVEFKVSIPKQQLPTIDFYCTSNQNAYGVVMAQWPDGDIFKISVKPNENELVDVNLQTNVYKKLQSVSNCNSLSNTMECASSK